MSDKFGLDYLINRGDRMRGGGDVASKGINVEATEEQGSPASENIERATVSVGGKILEELRRRRQTGTDKVNLKELVDAVGVEWDTLNVVCMRLEKLGLVEIERDKYGDHSIRLTQTGEDSLSTFSS